MKNLIQRSTISIPSNREKMLAKAKELKADFIMFDLEDSVPFDDKEKARNMIIEFLSWEDLSMKNVSYRINSLEYPFAYKDVIDVIEKVGDKIKSIVIPKVETPNDVIWVSNLIEQIERAFGISEKIEIEVSIETAKGLLNLDKIISSCSRIRSLVFGVADYTVSLGMFFKGISGHGEEEEFYPGHRFHYPLSKIAAHAKANGLLAIDAPYGNFKDLQGLKKSCMLSKYLGFDGKWAIHPAQVDIINEVFSPSTDEVSRCQQIVNAYEKVKEEGKGSTSLGGSMIDGATYRLAKQILDKFKKINR